MSMAEPLTALKAELLQSLVPQILDVLSQALQQGTALHLVEGQLWDLALQLGRRSLDALFQATGSGDKGETLTLPDGQHVQRLQQRHTRRYVSIFGAFQLERTVYGDREGQALAFVPLDNRMRYDEYLQAGYPIASGVIEGACRHLIKDRMERAGMHWTLAGAQAMLDLRSVWIGGHWEAFQEERIEHERERLYPHRDLVAGEAFFAVAG